mmetsp:Transcript_5339/g.11884  ORF Transcript_5339/g.11884 Transcript_5339/m.11884 type:complete len:105 (-) Transcript_5339:93-407(-)|eukprot:CAMPEP_0204330810 /NCGR_PEP_ID=MMETSP0469-20131031/15221_1 /ASSEMBLY_ACC=CAM_ASM_000384 /TAXON_ID=2969 /ORGANISM="Oxyrrhis marina" /LENGTH=104 /DNA_ID=CAMNT_0051313683 /DNA_START=5 /DNA_END=319 /DNA_ORIENTATION=+
MEDTTKAKITSQELADVASVTKPGRKGYSKVQIQAKLLAEQHDLDVLVEQMMNHALHWRPDNPKVFLARWLALNCTDDQLREIGCEVQRQPRQKGDPKEKKAPA